MEKIPEEITEYITKTYGYDRELLERLVDAFDMGEDRFATIKDAEQNICAFGFFGRSDYIYYGHVLKVALVSCLGVTKHGCAKDLFEILKKCHLSSESKTDIAVYEAESERFKKIYTRLTEGALSGSNCREHLTQGEALAYPENHDILLCPLSVDAFYPLYERWIEEREYQFAMIFSYDNLKRLEKCINLIAAYDKEEHLVGVTILYKVKHYFTDYLEPILFDAIDDCARKAIIRYLAENYGRNGKDILIGAYGKVDDPSFVKRGFIVLYNPYNVLTIYARAHPGERRIIHSVSERNPEASGYYTISGGVATYTTEPIDGAEELSPRELCGWLIPYSNCCFFF